MFIEFEKKVQFFWLSTIDYDVGCNEMLLIGVFSCYSFSYAQGIKSGTTDSV